MLMMQTHSLDIESRSQPNDHAALRLWLRLLTCTQLIEKNIRTQLRDQFATTLPRFDLMAQIFREPKGLRMSELGLRMMVTGGNVTAIVDQLESERLVERIAVPGDKRATIIRLTTSGRKQFAQMASEHEGWIVDAFHGLNNKETQQLFDLLKKVKLGMTQMELKE
jgi:DNA-binding MarR family transcriptional regulator